MSEKDLFDEIARIAYDLWERTGYIHGRDIEHWCEAEQIVISRMIPIEEEKSKKAMAPRKTPTKTKTATKSTGAATKARKSSGSSKKA